MEEQFGNRLMNLRKVKGLSQEDFGNLVGVSRQTVSKWESNQTTPEMDKLVSISDVFHISLDELLGREKMRRTIRIMMI
jgi:transcriptional regulator with XRE-family HTH domain